MKVFLRSFRLAGVLAVTFLAAGQPAATRSEAPARWIAFVSSQGSIGLVRSDGTGARSLRVPGISPAWSPRRNQLLYSCRPADQADWDLCVVNADGTGRRQLRQPQSDDLNGDWSPDATRLVFTSDQFEDETSGCTPKADIYTVKTDGSDRRQVTSELGSDLFPAWSPNGKRIVFTHTACGHEVPGPNGIFAVNPDGEQRVQLTENADDWEPAWSPDGRWIAFKQDVYRHPFDTDIAVMTANGKRVRAITSGPKADSSPTWSPDGKRIAFVRAGNLYITPANRRGPVKRLLANARSPDWQTLR